MNEYLLNYPTELPLNLPLSARALAKSHIVARYLSQRECREIIELYLATGNPDNSIGFEAYGGAINAVAPEATAFWHRRAMMDVFFMPFWLYENTRERADADIANFDRVVGALSNGHSYQNYPNRDIGNFGHAYFGGNLDRLIKVKKTYDPDNFFSFPQGLGNIPGKRPARAPR
jgi:FAD/FMN-containing dehydrogenase